jgi:hypothetical protein
MEYNISVRANIKVDILWYAKAWRGFYILPTIRTFNNTMACGIDIVWLYLMITIAKIKK